MSGGDKDIQIGISHFTIMAEIYTLSKLSGFFRMDTSVYPPEPVGFKPIKNNSGSNMYVRLKTSDIVICTPSSDS